MKPIDILYTPLDVKPVPDFDLVKMKAWMTRTYEGARPLSTSIITDEKVHGIEYPWHLTHAYFDMKGEGPGWVNDFDKEFPELAEYFSTVLDVPLTEFGEILFLPVKPDHNGFGFWHQDPDLSGIRLYLEFEDFENNKLLMRRTVQPYTHRYLLSHNEYMQINKYLQPELIDCKISIHRQWFYLNNDRAVHSTLTTVPNKERIAVIVSGRPRQEEKFMAGVEDLILRSAEKFKDYALYWDKSIPSNEQYYTKPIDFSKVKTKYPNGSK